MGVVLKAAMAWAIRLLLVSSVCAEALNISRLSIYAGHFTIEAENGSISRDVVPLEQLVEFISNAVEGPIDNLHFTPPLSTSVSIAEGGEVLGGERWFLQFLRAVPRERFSELRQLKMYDVFAQLQAHEIRELFDELLGKVEWLLLSDLRLPYPMVANELLTMKSVRRAPRLTLTRVRLTHLPQFDSEAIRKWLEGDHGPGDVHYVRTLELADMCMKDAVDGFILRLKQDFLASKLQYTFRMEIRCLDEESHCDEAKDTDMVNAVGDEMNIRVDWQGPEKLVEIQRMAVDYGYRNPILHYPSDAQSMNKLIMQAGSSQLHKQCRNFLVPYIHTRDVYRQEVPDAKVNWDVDWPGYRPRDYSSPELVGKPWADARNPRNCRFNAVDGQVNRVSFQGNYEVDLVERRPRNPAGRTGLQGRGVLGKWGPNHAADAIVTRRFPSNGKLQFVAIKRGDSGQWSLPGGMVDAGETARQAAPREFGEEALNSGEGGAMPSTLKPLWNKGVVIYTGYVDDWRNTDNAWIETTAFSYHDEQRLMDSVELKAGDGTIDVKWMDVQPAPQLYASHLKILTKLCQERFQICVESE